MDMARFLSFTVEKEESESPPAQHFSHAARLAAWEARVKAGLA